MAMKGEIFVDFMKAMFKKLIKTKIVVKRNVNFMLNLFYSYDIPHRSERYQRRSLENDKKLSRRHRKHRDTRDQEVIGGSMKNSNKDGVGQKKVSDWQFNIVFLEHQTLNKSAIEGESIVKW